MLTTPYYYKGERVPPASSKRFHTYIGREMLKRLLQFPYMRGADFHACPHDPVRNCAHSQTQDYKYIHSFVCMIFYRYSEYPMSSLEPTGNSIRGIIHRHSCATERTLQLFTAQVFAYSGRSAQQRMLRLLIRTFGQISLYNLRYRLVDLEEFDLELYNRMVHECFPDSYVVENEAEAYHLNRHKKTRKE